MGLYAQLSRHDGEAEKIVSLIRSVASGKARILDVGCGYGRFLRPLKELGFEVLGVEMNPKIAAANRAAGFSCVTPSEFQATEGSFDLILLSHVIEHFAPENLLIFLNGYLEKVKQDGHIVIATPLLSDYFFDDFDHVRPYHPESILMAFGSNGESQMQYHGTRRLELKDLWYRRAPFRFSFCRGRHINGISRNLFAVGNLALLLIHLVTFRWVGRPDGWVGLFRCSSRDQASGR